MSSVAQPSPQHTVVPIIYRLHRWFFALCILLAPLTLALWFSLCPTGAGDAACPDQGNSLAVFSAFRTMNPQLMQLLLALSLVAPYVYSLSYIGLGLLAMRRSPWFATLGIACGFAAGIVWGPIAGQISMIKGMAQLGTLPLFVTIEHRFYADWTTLAFGAAWVIGHLLGYVLVGIALARARAIPRWAAWLIVASVPLMGPIAYGTNLGLLQVLGYGLIFIASLPAAWAMLRLQGESALVPYSVAPPPASR